MTGSPSEGRLTQEAIHQMARRRRRGRSSLALFLVPSAAALAAGLWFSGGGAWLLDEATRVRAVEVRIAGAQAVTEEEVLSLTGLSAGTTLRRVPTAALRQRLRSFPRIADARFSYQWFQRLVIDVTERAPVAMIVSAEGKRLELAVDGTLLEPVGEGAADLPLLSWEGQGGLALAPGAVLDLAGGPDLMRTLRALQEHYPSLWQGISEAHLLRDGTYELYWIDAPTVVWGRGPLADARLRAWVTVMSDLRKRGENDAVVDLRFREQIVVRLPEEKNSPPAPLG